MKRKAKIYYIALDDFWRKEEKLAWLNDNPIEKIEFERLEPDAKHNWINQTDNDFEVLLPLIDKENKYGGDVDTIFHSFSNGVSTNRDEWVYDEDKEALIKKGFFLVKTFNESIKSNKIIEIIKWSSSLQSNYEKREKTKFDKNEILKLNYRPFSKQWYYSNKVFSDRLTNNHYQMFGSKFEKQNFVITFSGVNHSKSFQTLAVNSLFGLDFLEKTQSLPLYTYSENQKHENITDWALDQFQTHYANKSEPPALAGGLTDAGKNNPSANADGSDGTNGAKITKQDIFYYVYAVLHSPVYRKKYEQNLKREFPRLPFYDDFRQWRDWGERLMDLHINYETHEPFALDRKDLDLTAKKRIGQNSMFDLIGNKIIDDFAAAPTTKLRADKESGTIVIDSLTTLTGVPALAWEYKLGNRSALEWILDQYKEKKPQDQTIAEQFNTYRFEDYKETVIDLLKRVCNVSVKTMDIVAQMPNE